MKSAKIHQYEHHEEEFEDDDEGEEEEDEEDDGGGRNNNSNSNSNSSSSLLNRTTPRSRVRVGSAAAAVQGAPLRLCRERRSSCAESAAVQ